MKRTFLLIAAGLLVATASEAQESSRAQALFDEGRKLMAEGKFSEACPKLAASNRLDPGSGTLMNLGTCYERNRQLASAWATFKEAATLAHAVNNAERETAARERADKLEPDLPRLTITVTEPRATGLVVDRDGIQVEAAEYASAIPIDAGTHVIRAVATGKKTWTSNVTIEGPRARAAVTVPVLEDDPNAASPAPTPAPVAKAPAAAPVQDTGNMQRTLGLVAGGAGLVGVGLGVIFGFKAKSTYDDGTSHCNAAKQCPQDSLDKIDSAHTQATVSTIGFIAGGVFLAGGIVLYATAAHGDSGKVQVSFDGSRVRLGGTF